VLPYVIRATLTFTANPLASCHPAAPLNAACAS
jgi:hypothetical protein